MDRQGQISQTDRVLDVAVSGKGFIVTNTSVNGNGNWRYTRDGSFSGNAATLGNDDDGLAIQGTYLTTANGNYVFGWAANPDGTFTETAGLGARANSVHEYGNSSVTNYQHNYVTGQRSRWN